MFLKKWKFILLFFFFIVFLSVLVIGLLFWKESLKPASSSNQKVGFVIPKGYSASQIGNELYESKLIKSPLVFKFYVQVMNKSKSMKPGEFTLSPNMGLPAIVDKLLSGPDEIWVTIPEGLRKEEIAKRYAVDLGYSGYDADNFIKGFMSYASDKEGFLFPDTYLFPKDVNSEKIVQKMTDNLDLKLKDYSKEFTDGKTNQGLSIKEIIILASLIEREAYKNEERPIIAGILIKRMKTKGWLLQVDATVQYAIANATCKGKSECNWWPIVLKKDLDMISSYNTYKYPGLPPSPISNPGILSIEAAIRPKDSNFWFYMHGGNRQIHYAGNINEHNANIAKYLGK